MERMHERLKFSAAMCVYGGDNPQYFQEALQSVFEQTRVPDEVVLTVDGPIPETIDGIIKEYEKVHPQLKVVRLPVNLGHGGARRESIKACSNPVIAIADADDICLRERFETQMKCFEEDPALDVVGSNHVKFIGSMDNIVAISRRPREHGDVVRLMKRQCPVTQACVMFKRSIYDKAGGYVDWYCAEDYYLWIRMYEAGGKFFNCPETLVAVRTSSDQYKRRGGWKYFKSTTGISKYMYEHGIIGLGQHVKNIVPRFVLQVMLPANVRGFMRNIIINRKNNSIN